MPQVTTKELDDIRQALEEQAFLFEDPGAYQAGSKDALEALERIATSAPGSSVTDRPA